MEGHNSNKSIEVDQLALPPDVIFTPTVTAPTMGNLRQHSETVTAPTTGNLKQHSASPNQRDNPAQVLQQLKNQEIGGIINNAHVKATQGSNEEERAAHLDRKLPDE